MTSLYPLTLGLQFLHSYIHIKLKFSEHFFQQDIKNYCFTEITINWIKPFFFYSTTGFSLAPHSTEQYVFFFSAFSSLPGNHLRRNLASSLIVQPHTEELPLSGHGYISPCSLCLLTRSG